MARILVLRTAGTNCDEETAWAFRLAGADVESLHVGRLLDGSRRLDEFDGLALPGGFSYGDDLGAGTVLANRLRSRLADALAEFVELGRLVLGICNGFQVLVRLGILPGGGERREASLIENLSGKFEDRWTRLRVESNRSPFLAGFEVGASFRSPVAHREGRFVVRDPETLARLAERGQIALCYASGERDLAGETEASTAAGEYPANPNGSSADIAGITNEAGNVLGLMPHPERFVHGLHAPDWTRRRAGLVDCDAEELAKAGEGFAVFRDAVRFLDDAIVRIR